LQIPGLYDLDLVASHLREAAARAAAWGLPSTALCLASADEKSVAEFRQGQATAANVTLKAAKQIITEVGYGGSGADWQRQHKTSLPPAVAELRAELRPLIAKEYQEADEKVKAAVDKRPRPALTLMSVNNQIGERPKLDKMATVVQDLSHGQARLCGFLGDGGPVYDDGRDDDTLMQRILQQLSSEGVLCSYKVFPTTKEEYFDWLFWSLWSRPRHEAPAGILVFLADRISTGLRLALQC
jgi:hypothetical protein